MIKISWLASIWCQNDQSNAKLQTRSNYHEFASIWRPNDQKCWVTSQNIQNKAKLQKWSKYNDLHRFDVKTIKATKNSKRYQNTMNLRRFDVQTIKNAELRRKPFKKAKLQKWSKYNDFHRFDVKNFKTTHKLRKWSNWTSKRAKMLSYVAKHSKQRKTAKVIKLQWIASIWIQKHQNKAKLQKRSNDMNCIDLTSKRSKMLSYVAKHSKQR